MSASDRKLVFQLKDDPAYVNASSWDSSRLSSVPTNTIFLDLAGSEVAEDAILGLPDLPHLRCIDLDATGVTDASMERLVRFLSLEEIWIENTAVTDVGFLKLHNLRNLRYISIAYCDITDNAVEELCRSIPGLSVGG